METPMKNNTLLTVASVLGVLFFTVHLGQDIVRGIEKGTIANLPAIPMAVLWLYGALVLAGRRSGTIIVLLFSLLGILIPVIHMMGKGVGIHTNLAKYDGHFFFVWTLIALGVTSLFSVVLCVHRLWSMRKGQES
jgi:hypothetical protein